MKKELLDKYSVPVPRYTSYPPANFFTENFSVSDYCQAIDESNSLQPQNISIYIHIPFCLQLCYYCGCNTVLYQNKKIMTDYISVLKKELQLVLPLIDRSRKISQIHYGGGSPTSQPLNTLADLNDFILSQFDCIDNPEIAVECHPGYMNEPYWQQLAKAGFNRVSLGIQDFDENVLKASNRKPSRIPIKDIFAILRSDRISVNMDFIYGLPKQTLSSFSDTICKAAELHPDRLVTFSYAHVPWVNKLQLELEKSGLPTIEEKESMYKAANSIMESNGYKKIGLDHFVLPDDDLFIALNSGQLHRNFQGYCTRQTTGQVYAFGMTGISQLATAYAQNSKDMNSYMQMVNNGILPISKGYRLNKDEQIAREVITGLMCNYRIDWCALADHLGVKPQEVKSAMNYNESALAAFAKDGIIEYDDTFLSILPDATPFVRNVAASLDKLMLNTNKRFSKAI